MYALQLIESLAPTPEVPFAAVYPMCAVLSWVSSRILPGQIWAESPQLCGGRADPGLGQNPPSPGCMTEYGRTSYRLNILVT